MVQHGGEQVEQLLQPLFLPDYADHLEIQLIHTVGESLLKPAIIVLDLETVSLIIVRIQVRFESAIKRWLEPHRSPRHSRRG